MEKGNSSVNDNEKPKGGLPTPHNSILDYLLIIKERIFIGVAAAIILSGVYAYINFRQTPVYFASSSLLFEPEKRNVVRMQQVVDIRGGVASMRSMRSQLLSSDYRNYVIKRLSPK